MLRRRGRWATAPGPKPAVAQRCESGAGEVEGGGGEKEIEEIGSRGEKKRWRWEGQ